jgi:hypothetical protein
LISQAPAELTKVFGTASGGSNIDSVTFEYCSVALTRPWFRPEVFDAQFWRFSDSSTQLSDGNVPPQGEWPAYITALIFARNVVVKTHGDTNTATQPVHPFLMIAAHVAPAVQPPPASHPAPAQSLARPMMLRSPSIMMMQPAMRAQTVEFHPQVNPVTPVRSLAIGPAAYARLNASTFASAPAAAQPAQAPLGAGTAPTGTSQPPPAGPAQVSILAFICKRLPKCPNPDPTLNWG